MIAVEQDRPDVARRRRQWIASRHRIDPDRLVFIDETWIKTNMAPLRGWAARGHRLKQKAPFGHWNTMTFIAALRRNCVDAPWLIDGAINGERFRLYVEKVLVPVLHPGDIVIMDNLRSHRSKTVRQAIRAAGAKLFLLPKYSPDLNPIEQLFSKTKHELRKAAKRSKQTDYAGPTVPVIDPTTGIVHPAQIFVAVLGASNLTFAYASFSQKLVDWIDGHVRALTFYGGVTKGIICDNLKAAVAKALWFEPTLNATFAAFAEHYDTTVLPARSRKPRDKGRVEGAVLIVERWILARLRNRTFFSLAALNEAIAELIEDLNNRPMRHIGKSRRELFEEIEREALAPLPAVPFEYSEWKTAKVHPDYHVEVDKTFYSVPHRLIGCNVEVRLTHRVVEIFHDHNRVASHVRRSQRSGHVTVSDHMPKAHQRYANTTPRNLIERAERIGSNVAILVERMMRDRPHPEQGYRSAMGILSLAPRYGPERLDAACERALTINAVSYSSVASILKSGLDRDRSAAGPAAPTPQHANIRGGSYYQ